VTTEDVGLLALRVVVGGIYIAHGARKLGWRSTKGGFRRFRDSIAVRGYRPATLWALSAVVAEMVGGLLAVAGLVTPFAGAMLLAQSVTIVVLVVARGFWVEDMGVEYPLMLGTAALAVALAGPGRLSLDAVLGLGYEPWLAPALVVGAALGALAGLLTRRPAAA
jgi:putative oxidoreductase